MRIIKSGIEIKVNCPGCKSILGVEPSDVQDCSAVGSWVICPMCNKRIEVKVGDMPDLFRRQVDWDE